MENRRKDNERNVGNNCIMGNTMNYKEVRELAKKRNEEIAIKDFVVDKKCRIVEFLHCDRTYCSFVSACVERLDEEWFVIYTEHHGFFVYHVEDLEWLKSYTRSDEQTHVYNLDWVGE